NGTSEVVRAFLRGYFDGDGYCSAAPTVSTASQRLAEEVMQLLLGLGVYASIRRRRTDRLPAFLVTAWDTPAFAREVGFTDYGFTKDRALQRLLKLQRNTNVDIVPGVGRLLRRAARRVSVRTSRRDAWCHISAYYGDRKPSYHMLRSLLEAPEALPACDERDELQRIVNDHYAWSQVESRRPSVRRRIDCEVEEQHTFIGNGLVNHNTVIAGSIISRAAMNGERVLFLAHRRELINQAYRKLLDFGLPAAAVGVMMASDPRRRPGAPVQVASVDTLRSRAKPSADLVFTDECHRALSQTHRGIAAHYPNARHIGLTATPYRADGKGLGDAYDELLLVASPRQLIDEGFLVEPRIFTVPYSQRPDLSKVKISNGDYAADALEQAVDRTALVGNIVEHWLEHAAGIRTVVFAVSVAHSRHIAERFRAAGITAEHLDGMTPTLERDAILKRLDRGETLVVSGVGVLAEGWDQPSVKCAILARPTKSTGLYLQQAGRILRPWQNQPAIILDHGGCALEHGLPQDDREFSLEGRKKRTKTQLDSPVRECPSCNAVLAINSRICPECGYQLLAERDLPEEAAGKLVEVSAESFAPARKRSNATEFRTTLDALRNAARSGNRVSWELIDRTRTTSPPSQQQSLAFE
ncbi:MAG TPA: DEAD/DEAH box helicase family protein, partial [Polyangiaceae bacterium]|nr:DEAD/DEAH box helicase family protein [Polyangiaceae bacterium]